MTRRKVIIIGAAGRDFHNFNTRYRADESTEVVAFTAEQIPGIEDRTYPPELAGPLYPNGIPIHAEEDLPRLIDELDVDECAFSYSDVSYAHVMGVSAIVQAAGAAFTLIGPKDSQIESSKPLVSVCAVRTGAGKSQTSRKVVETLMGTIRRPRRPGGARLHDRGDGGVRASHHSGERDLRRRRLRGHSPGRRAGPERL
jgi:predicted GTPase